MAKARANVECLHCEASEHAKAVLDANPLCCIFWSQDLFPVDCNEAVVALFGLTDKETYLKRFFELSPERQPDGNLSSAKVAELVQKAFDVGHIVFEWLHQKLDGEPIPCEITLKRLKYGREDLVIGYTRDLRGLKISMADARDANERARIMFETTPLSCSFWDENLNCIDCSQIAVKTFGLSNKKEYLERFWELSPEHQPDGAPSKEKMLATLQSTLETGSASLEWMHQTLDGEPVPSEVTLVRVVYQGRYVVLGYTRDLRELKKTVSLLNHLEQLAFIDPLTGTYNRRYFLEKGYAAFSEYSSLQNPLSLIMMDLDFFKDVNDSLGHAAGDEVLKSVAQVVQRTLRGTDLLARYGGEEFIILLQGAGRALAVRFAERLRRKIRSTRFYYRENLIRLTVSLGVVTKTDAATTLEEALELVDKALYQAKNSGRDRVEVL